MAGWAQLLLCSLGATLIILWNQWDGTGHVGPGIPAPDKRQNPVGFWFAQSFWIFIATMCLLAALGELFIFSKLRAERDANTVVYEIPNVRDVPKPGLCQFLSRRVLKPR